jgi:hypothetical protein
MEKHMVCPRCNGVARLIAPVKNPTGPDQVAYGCPACGLAFNSEKQPILDNQTKLRDIFRGASAGHQTVLGILKGMDGQTDSKSKSNAASMALAESKMLEYGVQMWFDGLRQGLLLGTIETMKGMDDGETGSES